MSAQSNGTATIVGADGHTLDCLGGELYRRPRLGFADCSKRLRCQGCGQTVIQGRKGPWVLLITHNKDCTGREGVKKVIMSNRNGVWFFYMCRGCTRYSPIQHEPDINKPLTGERKGA